MRERIVRRRLADGTLKTYRYGPKVRTVGAIIEEYRGSAKFGQLRLTTRTRYLRALEALEPYHDIPIADIKRRHVLALQDAYQDRPATANLVLTMWSILLQFAVEREYRTDNPAIRIQRLKMGEHARWPDEAIAYALKTFPEPMRRGVLLALYTGQREGDCVAMRWSDYDGDAVQVTQIKTGTKLWIPCHGELRAALDGWKAGAGSTTILVNSYGRPWASVNAFAAVVSAEIGKHVELTGLVFHGLRKSAAARLAEAGCSLHEIASITGHKSLAQIQLYTREVEQKRNARAAITRLESYRRK